MASSSGGRSELNKNKITGNRFDILSQYKDNFPDMDESSVVGAKNKRKRAETVSYITPSFFSKNQKISDLIQGPKYIIMKRANSELTLSSVSPFLVMKCIESSTGKPKSAKLLRDGSLLILTTSKKQADSLCKINQLNNEIHVKVFEHPSLNQSKGIIRCKNIIVASDEEIKEGLKDQHVVDVYRIKRRDGDLRIATGAFILTFNLSQLPTHVDAGYERIEVLEYVPNPRRCFNCQRYGHGAKYCKQTQGICGNCSEPQHGPAECVSPILCPNCHLQHPAWNRSCPIFQQELKIQQIQTSHRISNFEARQRYTEQNPKSSISEGLSFARVIDDVQPSSSSKTNSPHKSLLANISLTQTTNSNTPTNQHKPSHPMITTAHIQAKSQADNILNSNKSHSPKYQRKLSSLTNTTVQIHSEPTIDLNPLPNESPILKKLSNISNPNLNYKTIISDPKKHAPPNSEKVTNDTDMESN